MVEEFVEGKSTDRVCEDLIVVTPNLAAVIDGATDETGATFDGKAGGHFAADTLAGAIRALAPNSTAREHAHALSSALTQAATEASQDNDEPTRWPSASLVCLSFDRHEIWRIGDCSFMIDGEPDIGTKRVDDAAYGFRAAINAALLAAGTPLDEILRTDPGARFTRPPFDLQQELTNQEGYWGKDASTVGPSRTGSSKCFPSTAK